MKGWIVNMIWSSNPEVRKRGKALADKLRSEHQADLERLWESPGWKKNPGRKRKSA